MAIVCDHWSPITGVPNTAPVRTCLSRKRVSSKCARCLDPSNGGSSPDNYNIACMAPRWSRPVLRIFPRWRHLLHKAVSATKTSFDMGDRFHLSYFIFTQFRSFSELGLPWPVLGPALGLINPRASREFLKRPNFFFSPYVKFE